MTITAFYVPLILLFIFYILPYKYVLEGHNWNK